MLDFRYSSKFYKRFIFKFICVFLSVLLSIMMFNEKAFAQTREMLDNAAVNNALNDSDSVANNGQLENDLYNAISSDEVISGNLSENSTSSNSENSNDNANVENIVGSNIQSSAGNSTNFKADDTANINEEADNNPSNANGSYTNTQGATTSLVSSSADDDFIEVYTYDQLKVYLTYSNKVRLLSDITLEDGSQFSFSGVLDGNGCTISYVNSEWESTGGLFSSLSGTKDNPCEILNLTVDITKTSENQKAGILADTASGVVNVKNCNIKGNFSNRVDIAFFGGLESYVGGVFGYVNNGAAVSLSNVTNAAKISSVNYLYRYGGGLIGYSEDASIDITNCTCTDESSVSALGSASWWFPIVCEVVKFAAFVLTGAILSNKALFNQLTGINETAIKNTVADVRKAFENQMKNSEKSVMNLIKSMEQNPTIVEQFIEKRSISYSCFVLSNKEEFINLETSAFLEVRNEYAKVLNASSQEERDFLLYGKTVISDDGKIDIAKNDSFWHKYEQKFNEKLQSFLPKFKNGELPFFKGKYKDFAERFGLRSWYADFDPDQADVFLDMFLSPESLIDYSNFGVVIWRDPFCRTPYATINRDAQMSLQFGEAQLPNTSMLGFGIMDAQEGTIPGFVLDKECYGRFMKEIAETSSSGQGVTYAEYIRNLKEEFKDAEIQFREGLNDVNKMNKNLCQGFTKKLDKLGKDYERYLYNNGELPFDTLKQFTTYDHNKLFRIYEDSYLDVVLNDILPSKDMDLINFIKRKFSGNNNIEDWRQFIPDSTKTTLKMFGFSEWGSKVYDKVGMKFFEMAKKEFPELIKNRSVSEYFLNKFTFDFDFQNLDRVAGAPFNSSFRNNSINLLIKNDILPAPVSLVSLNLADFVEEINGINAYDLLEYSFTYEQELADPGAFDKLVEEVNARMKIVEAGFGGTAIGGGGASAIYDNLRTNLSEACENFPSSDEGLGAVHYDGFGGGFIGRYAGKSGSSSHVNITNSSFNSGCYAGHASGGMIGYVTNCNLNINQTQVNACIGSTDVATKTYSGGFIGIYADSSGEHNVEFNDCLINGNVMCRSTSGGYIGKVDDGDVAIKFTNCGSVAGIAGTSGVGGYIGFENAVKSISFENCYGASEFDTTTLDATVIHSGSWFFMDDIIIEPTSESIYENDPAAYIGDGEHESKYYWKNCYRTKTYPTLGGIDSSDDKYVKTGGVEQVTENEMSEGVVTYKLNNAGDIPGNFGQVLDNLMLNDTSMRAHVPLPGFNAKVYKDEISAKTIYTNYNPRNMNVHTIFLKGSNVQFSPNCEYTRVIDGTDLVVSVMPDSDHNITKATATYQSSGKEVVLKNSADEGSPFFTYKFEDVSENIQIDVTTSHVDPVKPSGNGVAGDPYVISNALELWWFNKQISGNFDRNVYAKLSSNIDFSNYQWIPLFNIISFESGFAGEFDGCGYTISGIAPNGKDLPTALFGNVEGGTIKNLNVSGNFANAGICFSARNANIENCKVSGTINGSGSYAYGGITAVACEESTITNCVSSATFNISGSSSSDATGGIVGLVTDNTYYSGIDDDDTKCNRNEVHINNSKNYGYINSSTHYSGGVVGTFRNWDRDDNLGYKRHMELQIENCSNGANITSSAEDTCSGGILGSYRDLYSPGGTLLRINKCLNTGFIGYDSYNKKTPSWDAGGIIGVAGSFDSILLIPDSTCDVDLAMIQCINKGNVYSGHYAGGLIGNYVSSWDPDCWNTASLAPVDSRSGYYGMYIGCTPDTIIAGEFDWNAKFDTRNVYHYANGLKLEGSLEDCFDHDESFEADKSMVESGELAYRLGNDGIGQNIDVLSRTQDDGRVTYYEHQASPLLIDDKTQPVYKNEGDLSKYIPMTTIYTNHSLEEFKEDPDATYSDIKVDTEGEGVVDGVCRVKNGTNAKFRFEGKDGWMVDYYELDGNKVDTNVDECEFIVNEDHSLKVYFTKYKEPENIDGVYQIGSSFELAWLSENLKDEDTKVKLINNIVIPTSRYNSPIGSSDAPFKGEFDGNGKYINSNSSKPIFGVVDGSDTVIKNLTLNYNPYEKGAEAGLIDTMKNGTLDNVRIEGIYNNCNDGSVGGLVLKVDGGSVFIKHCVSDLYILNDSKSDLAASSAFVAIYEDGDLMISDCTNNGTISGFICGGAIARLDNDDSDDNVRVANFVNNGKISATDIEGSAAGGICGYDWGCDADVIIIGCTNNGDVYACEGGGIFGTIGYGDPSMDLTIYECSNFGNIGRSDSHRIGGIVGHMNDNNETLKITYCVVKCDDIKADNNRAGGFVGDCLGCSKLDIENSYLDVESITAYEKGTLIGYLKDMDHSFDNVYLHCDNLSKKIGKYFDTTDPAHWWDIGLDEDGYDTVDKDDIASGYVAYKIADGHQDYIGQVLDAAGMQRENYPKIDSPKVYKVNDRYTNHEHSDPNNYLVTIFAMDGSKDAQYTSNNFYIPKDKASESYKVDIVPFSGEVIERIKINGKDIDVRSNVSDNSLILTNVTEDTKIEYYISNCSKPDGDGSADNPYRVYRDHELLWIAKAVNSGETDMNVTICNDIDMSKYSWTSIGTSDNKFSGTITGINDAVISNISGKCKGFIGYASGATVKNIKLNNINISNDNAGGLAYSFKNGLVENVNVTGVITGNGKSIGGIIAEVSGNEEFTPSSTLEYETNHPYGARIYNCTSTIDFKENGSYSDSAKVGGIVGKTDSKSSVILYNCVNNSVVITNNASAGDSDGDDSGAGILAYVHPNDCYVNIYNCINNKVITAGCAGGIIGSYGVDGGTSNNGNVTVKYCENHGTIYGSVIGGLIGNLKNSSNGTKANIELINCINKGFVNGAKANYSGGIVGYLNGPTVNLTVNAAASSGDVCGSSAAGVVGTISNAASVEIKNSYASGVVNGSSTEAAILINKSSAKCIVNNCLFCKDTASKATSGDNVETDENVYNVTKEEVVGGKMGYLLNTNMQDSEYHFGQVIDDLTYNKDKELSPNPLSKTEIYKISEDLYSNFKDSKYTITVVTKNEGDTSDKYSDKGDVFILNTDGSVGCSILGTMFFTSKIDLYSFAAKPKDGNLITKIVIDGEERDVSAGDNLIRFKSSEINSNHTIYVEFAYFKIPDKHPTEDKTYLIRNYNELLWFANQVNKEGNNDINAWIVDDIHAFSFNDDEWEPIKSFKGKFEGHADYDKAAESKTVKITGIENKSNSDGKAFFDSISNATISNIEFSVDFTAEARVSALAKDVTSSTISNVTMNGNIYSVGERMAGFVQNVYGKTTFDNCVNNISMNKSMADDGWVGGFVAFVEEDSDITMKNCINNSGVYSNLYSNGVAKSKTDYAGGMIGLAKGGGTKVTLDGCRNNGEIRGDRCSGMIASLDDRNIFKGKGASHLTINNCVNTASVVGDHCGSMLGIIDDVSDDSTATLNACNNEGQIGSLGTVLKTAGGMIGELDDKDLTTTIDGCVNTGSVLNDESTALKEGSGIHILTVGLGAIGAYDAVYNMAVVGGGPAGYCLFALELVVSLAFSVQDIINSRLYIFSYAGGMVGHDSMTSGSLTVKNSEEFGLLQARDEQHPMVNSFAVPDCENDYALSENIKDEDGIHYRDIKAFATGEAAYSLQEANSAGNFGQVIDLQGSQYAKQGIPFIGAQEYAHVYKKEYTHTNDNGEEVLDNTIYTNYDPKEFKDDPCALYINSKWGDSGYTPSSNPGGTFDTVVEGSRTYGALSPDYPGKYSLKTSEGGHLIFTPHENYSIFDVDVTYRDATTKQNIPLNIFKQEVVYNEDGSITKLINPTYLESNSIDGYKILKSYDIRVMYNTDGTVVCDIAIPSSQDKECIVDVSVLENEIQVHECESDGTPTIFYPWTSEKSLPNIADKNWYLVNNVELDASWTVPAGNIDLCLNGHGVVLKDGASINVDNEKSKLAICDCNKYSPKFLYNISDDGNYDVKEYQEDSIINDVIRADGLIYHGVIYNVNEANTINDKAMFNLNNGYVSVYNVTLCESYSRAAFDINKANAKLYFDAEVCGSPLSNPETQEFYGTFNVNANMNVDSIKIGKNSNFIENAKVSEYADIYFKGIEKGHINFDEEYNVASQIKICSDTDVVLTHNYYKLYTEKNIDYSNLFKMVGHNEENSGSEWVIAFGNGAVINSENFLNELWLCKTTSTSKLNVEVSGPGTVWPNENTIVKSNSDVKLHYSANALASLMNVCYTVTENETSDVIQEISESDLSDTGDYVINDVNDELLIDGKHYRTTNKIVFDFASSKDIALDIDEWQDWNNSESLPSIASETKDPIGYKLQCDIKLGEAWLVPDGKLAVDLNGHTISFNTEDGYKNDNLIYINHENTILTITDSAQANGKHYIYINDDNQYVVSDTPGENNTEITGGLIYGSNTAPKDYRKFNYSAGAIVVESGALNLHKGSVVGNNNIYINEHNSGSLDGGAGITVKEKASLNVFKDASISYNTNYGDIEYESTFFSAGVASKGNFYNEGKITNNTALSFATAAVSALSGSFENTGIISNNKAMQNKDNHDFDSLGSVLSYVAFSNAGKITDNYADFDCPAITTLNKLTLLNESEISGNKYFDSEKVEDCNLDLNFSSLLACVEIDKTLKVSKPSIIKAETNQVFTRNWASTKLNISDVFTSSDEDLLIGIGEGAELKLTTKDKLVDANFNILGNGSINLINEKYVIDENIPISINADKGNRYNSTLIEGRYVDSAKADLENRSIMFNSDFIKNNKSDEIVKQNVDVHFDTQAELNERGSVKVWYSTVEMPKEAGQYRIEDEVDLDGPWFVPSGDIEIDMKGHRLALTTISGSVMFVDNADTKLTINDSVKTSKHYLSQVDGAYGYHINDNDTSGIELNGAVIGGVNIQGNNSYYDSAITVLKGEVVVNSGNIVANNAINADTGAGINVLKDGKITLGKDVFVGYNYAMGLEDKSFETVASIKTAGKVTNYGTIDTNVALNDYATASVYVYDRGTFENYGFVQKEGEDWLDPNSLPSEKGKYILQQDITLSESWIAPEGYCQIDLNGYNILQTDASDYVFQVINDKSNVSIRDSVAYTTSLLSKVNGSDNQEVYVANPDGNIEVEGPIIGHTRYSKTNTCGVALVQNGRFYVEKATLAGNNVAISNGVNNIAAGISVGEQGKLRLSCNVKICYNSAIGDYGTRDYVSAGVYAKGELVSDANVFNNIAKDEAVAAYYVNNSVDPVIGGKISNNTASEYSVSALVADSLNNLTLEAEITQNSAYESSKTVEIKDSVVSNNNSIFNNVAYDESSFAGVYLNNNKRDIQPTIKLMRYSYISENVYNGNLGETIKKQDLFVSKKANYPQIIVTDSLSTQITKNPINLVTEDMLQIGEMLTLTKGYTENNNNPEDTNKLFAYMSELPENPFIFPCNENGEVDLCIDNTKKFPWFSENSLPDVPWNYYLINNVVLDSAWVAPDATMSIDLWGHSITPSKENTGLINVKSANANLLLNSSVSDSVYRLSKDNDNVYSLDDKGSVELKGSVIGGVSVTGNSAVSAIAVSDGKLEIDNINVVANNVNAQTSGLANMSPSISVEQNALLTLSKTTNVAYNTAVGKDLYNVSAAINCDGNSNEAVNKGTISNNYASNFAAVVSVLNSAKFKNTGNIYNNEANNHSVAAVYIARSSSHVNDGEIKDNKAKDNSYIMLSKSAKQFNNSGEIPTNEVSDNSHVISLNENDMVNTGIICKNTALLSNSEDKSCSAVFLEGEDNAVVLDGAGSIYSNYNYLNNIPLEQGIHGCEDIGSAFVKFTNAFDVKASHHKLNIASDIFNSTGYKFTEGFNIVRQNYEGYKEYFTNDGTFNFNYDRNNEVYFEKTNEKSVYVYPSEVGGQIHVKYNGTEINTNQTVVPAGSKLDFSYTANSNYEFEGWYNLYTCEKIDPNSFTVEDNVIITALFKDKNVNTSIRVYQLDDFDQVSHSARLLKRYSGVYDAINLGHNSKSPLYWSDVNIDSSKSGAYDLQLEYENIGKSVNLSSSGGTYLMTFRNSEVNEHFAKLNAVQEWTEAEFLPEECGTYKLMNDVYLSESYTPAESGSTTIDLNGHNIIQTSLNTNAIYINSEMTNLTIKDTSFISLFNSTRINKLKMNDGEYRTFEIDENGDYEVPGGIIGGAKFESCEQPGAIYVEKGTLNLNGGTIACNYLDNSKLDKDCFGAAGLTVNKEAIVNISSTTTFNDNTSVGNSSSHTLIASAISNLGTCTNKAWITYNFAYNNAAAGIATGNGSNLDNAGLIDHNYAYNWSVASILANGAAVAKNSGNIKDNVCLDISVCFAVLNCTAENNGVISNNISTDSKSFAGLYLQDNNSHIILDGASKICNNAFVSENSSVKQDIRINNVENCPIQIGSYLDVNSMNFLAGVEIENPLSSVTQLTKGFGNRVTYPVDPNEIFTMPDNKYSVVYGKSYPSNELFIVENSSDNVVNARITSNEGGKTNYSGVTKLLKNSGFSFILQADADFQYYIKEIRLNGAPLNISEFVSRHELPLNDSKDFNVEVIFDKLSKANSNTLPNTSNYIAVSNETELLSYIEKSVNNSPVNLKLVNDIQLSEAINPAKDSLINIDLGGNFLIGPKNDSVIRLDNENSVMNVYDTSEAVHKFSKDAIYNCIYERNEMFGNISIVGGGIYGGHANDGAGIYVSENCKFTLNDANILGCVAENNGGAIYNEGVLEVNGVSTIAGNAALAGAGVYNYNKSHNPNSKNGVFTNAGIISDNFILLKKQYSLIANPILVGAGVFNCGIMNIKDNSNISENYTRNCLLPAWDKNRDVHQDIYLDYLNKDYLAMIFVVDDIYCNEKVYAAFSPKEDFAKAMISQGFSKYGYRLGNNTFMTNSDDPYSVLLDANGELIFVKKTNNTSSR